MSFKTKQMRNHKATKISKNFKELKVTIRHLGEEVRAYVPYMTQ